MAAVDIQPDQRHPYDMFFAPSHTLVVAVGVMEAFFILCGFFLCYLCTRVTTSYGRFFNWLLVCLTISNMMLDVVFIERAIMITLGDVRINACNHTIHCVLSSVFYTISLMSSLTWTFCIGICCTLTILGKLRERRNIWRRQIILSFANWGLPVVITVIALISGVLGRTQTGLTSLCWIRTCNCQMTVNQQVIWMGMTRALWESLAYFTIVNLLFVGVCCRQSLTRINVFSWATDSSSSLTVASVNHEDQSSSESQFASENYFETEFATIQSKKLFLWIPVVMLLCRVWGSARFGMDVHAMVRPASVPKLRPASTVLLYFQIMGEGSPTFFNLFLVFIFSSQARSWMKLQIQKIRRNRSRQSDDTS